MATFDSKWRFDPAKGGVYDSSLDDEDKPDVPAISADTSAMPDDSPTAFSVGSGGTSAPPPAPSAPAAPTPAAAAGETFGIPNTTTPLTLTGDTSHTNVTRKVTTAQDALAQGAMANAAEEQVGSLRTQGELEAKQKLDEAGTHEQRKGVYEANNKLRSTAIQETEAQKSLLATKAATLQKVIDGTKITDGWSDERMGSRVPAVLGLILNGIGRGLSGNHGPDELFASLQERIARDHAEHTGVLNANEYTRYTKATDTTLLSGREATAKGLDVLKNSMGDHYTANLMAKSIALPGEGAKPAAEPAPASPRAKPARARPSTADAKAIQWALKHSNDPLAKEILQENGH
jgi:hypothetical protein